MLTVLEPATDPSLVSLSLVKAELNISGSDSDSLLLSYIASASGAISDYCHRIFPVERVAEAFGAETGRGPLILRRYPIQSIESVTVEDEELVAEVDYTADYETGLLYRLSGDCRVPWTERALVVYSGGYNVIPPAIQRAALRTVTSYWTARGRDPALKYETIVDVLSFALQTQAAGIPDEAAALAEAYKDCRLP